MREYKYHGDRKSPGRLPLFPAPYPGESFYSVLCRYHIRSGNINDWHTIRQLFGYNSSMGSTLLTPFHLEKVRYWVPATSDITAKKMLHENTAFTLCVLYSHPYDTCPGRIREVISGRKPITSFPRHAQSRLANPAGRLRFCPKCAKEQEELYGEPYWQVLPQLDEAEYCPLHKVRIRNTSLPLKSIRQRFYPASMVLKDPSLSSTDHESDWEDLFDQEKSFFIRLSQNIGWLLQNGIKYESPQNLRDSYIRATNTSAQKSHWYSINTSDIRRSITALSLNDRLYNYLERKNPSVFFGNTAYVCNLRICSHILLITALSGHPKVFYQK